MPPGPQLPSQPVRGLLPVLLLAEQRHDGCEQFAYRHFLPFQIGTSSSTAFHLRPLSLSLSRTHVFWRLHTHHCLRRLRHCPANSRTFQDETHFTRLSRSNFTNTIPGLSGTKLISHDFPGQTSQTQFQDFLRGVGTLLPGTSAVYCRQGGCRQSSLVRQMNSSAHHVTHHGAGGDVCCLL